MNLPSEVQGGTQAGVPGGTQKYFASSSTNPEAAGALNGANRTILPFEYLTLAGDDGKATGANNGSNGAGRRESNKAQRGIGKNGDGVTSKEHLGRDTIMRNEIERARQEGQEAGNQEGRRAARGELEEETHTLLARERERLIDAVKEFSSAREQYFTGVEQEVVRLALGIAERVLHREAQIDPILLAGVVRVALEKMADRSGVVLRVSQPDVDAWKLLFHAAEHSERPQVIGDARLQRGDCVLETKMGTVELGVSVQLEEIEKGFFDLLNHRPVQ
jgi:flagellar assembly protein FliH